MGPVSAFVVFAVTWFLALYCLLPFGIRNHEEAGEELPEGADTGSPVSHGLRLKMIWATVIAALITGTAYLLIEGGILTHDRIDGWLGTG